MPKIHKFVECRVVVYPDDFLVKGDAKALGRRCEEIARQIKRHCDGFDRVEVNHEYEHVCSYCGAAWTEDSADFNGGCCDKDMEHEPKGESQCHQ